MKLVLEDLLNPNLLSLEDFDIDPDKLKFEEKSPEIYRMYGTLRTLAMGRTLGVHSKCVFKETTDNSMEIQIVTDYTLRDKDGYTICGPSRIKYKSETEYTPSEEKRIGIFKNYCRMILVVNNSRIKTMLHDFNNSLADLDTDSDNLNDRLIKFQTVIHDNRVCEVRDVIDNLSEDLEAESISNLQNQLNKLQIGSYQSCIDEDSIPYEFTDLFDEIMENSKLVYSDEEAGIELYKTQLASTVVLLVDGYAAMITG